MICLSSCPVGTHLRNGTLECVPCHEGCDPAAGCVGSLPYLDLGNGCLDCDRVILNRNGTQVSSEFSTLLYVLILIAVDTYAIPHISSCIHKPL